MLRVLMVASEMAPLAKVGGLADVMSGLPRALTQLGVETAVVIPRYRSISLREAQRAFHGLRIWLGWRPYDCDIWVLTRNGVPVFLVDQPALFDREGTYQDPSGNDYADNHVRFAVLSRAALEITRYLFRPQIIHCHDWQAAPVILYARSTFALDPTFIATRFVCTIHNLGYQGIFDRSALVDMALEPSLWTEGWIEFYGRVNLLKGAILLADHLTTVSPTYAREIQTPAHGHGLENIVRQRADALVGILNGIDDEYWNPEQDPHLPAPYNQADLSGKRIAKQQLMREYGWEPDLSLPLLGMVSRLVQQKGLDLLEAISDQLLERQLRLVVLGTGEARYEQLLERLATSYPEKFAIRITFDEALAHRVIAGCDILLMPSQYEPCGLTQMYAMRYGTIPVVHATGGLADSVSEDVGFRFAEYTPQALLEAIDRAVTAFTEPEAWQQRIQRAMSKDFSWRGAAARYLELYERLVQSPVS